MLSSPRGAVCHRRRVPSTALMSSSGVWNDQDDPECTILCVNVFQAGLPSSVLRPESIHLSIKPQLLQLHRNNFLDFYLFIIDEIHVSIMFWDKADDGSPAQPLTAL